MSQDRLLSQLYDLCFIATPFLIEKRSELKKKYTKAFLLLLFNVQNRSIVNKNHSSCHRFIFTLRKLDSQPFEENHDTPCRRRDKAEDVACNTKVIGSVIRQFGQSPVIHLHVNIIRTMG